MAIYTSTSPAFEAAGYIEAGQGLVTFNSGESGSQDVVLNLEKIDLPIEVGSSVSVKAQPGSFFAAKTGTASAIAPISAANYSGDVRDSDATLQTGNGAAFITNGEEKIYVKLNKLNYPFEFSQVGSEDTAIHIVGENSYIGLSS